MEKEEYYSKYTLLECKLILIISFILFFYNENITSYIFMNHMKKPLIKRKDKMTLNLLDEIVK